MAWNVVEGPTSFEANQVTQKQCDILFSVVGHPTPSPRLPSFKDAKQ